MPDKKRILMQNMHHPIYMQKLKLKITREVVK